MIANRITPACPYILPSARRRSGMVARQVRRSVVMSNLQIRLLPMDSDRTPLEKGKDVLHGAARAAPLRQSVEQPCPVHAFVLKGRWRYLEHDWVATEGSYAFEPPGETHTLVVDEDVEEMITYFQVNGSMYYVDPWGKNVGFEDVFTKLDMCRKHYKEVGLGEDYVMQFVR